MKGMHLRHLVFTGPNVEPAELEFVDGTTLSHAFSGRKAF